MKLNHANLFTSDVAALSGVFARHFAFEVEQASGEFALMRGCDDFFLVLMKIGPDSPRIYPNAAPFNFHVGFIVDTSDEVYAKHRELSEGGCNPGSIKSFEAMGATWTAFYCPVGDGIDIEVTSHT